MRIRIRLDRAPSVIPAVGDVLQFTRGRDVQRWKVVEREHEGPGFDAINEQLWTEAIVLELERLA